MDLEEGLPGEMASMADFGLMTDEEWSVFQISSEFTAGMAQKRKKALEFRLLTREHQVKAEKSFKREQDTDLHANLDVVCSMRTVGVEEAWSAVFGVVVGFQNSHSSAGKLSFDAGAMFEITRRNYLYHVSLLVFEPEKRIRMGLVVLNDEDGLRSTLLTILMVIFAECFSEKIIYGDELLNGGSAREIQVGVEKYIKRM